MHVDVCNILFRPMPGTISFCLLAACKSVGPEHDGEPYQLSSGLLTCAKGAW